MATKQKPAFDPNKAYSATNATVVEKKPAFDPSKPSKPAQNTLGVLSEGFIEQKAIDDAQMNLVAEVNKLDNANSDEKEWLRNTSKLIGQKMPDGKEFTIDNWNEAKKVLNKESEEFGKSIFGGPSRTAYYWDEQGMPKPLKYGEKPPVNAQIASAWGGSQSAENDTWATNLSKGAWNGFVDILNLPVNLYDVAQTVVTGTESELASTVRNTTDRLKFATKSNEGLVDTKAFTGLSEFVNSENWNFNDPYAVTSALGQGIGSLAQFVTGTGVVNKWSKGIKGASQADDVAVKATDWLSRNKNAIAASSMVSLNEALDVADKAGITGREKAAFATTTAIGVGMLEFLGGLETSTMKALGMTAKKELSEAAAKSFIASGGKLTAEGLKEAFDATLKTGAKKFPEWAKQGLLEASEEVAQTYYTAASADAYRKLDGRADFKSDLTSAETMKDAFEGAFVGFALGAGGQQLLGDRGELQLDNAYKYLKEGKKTELLQELHNLRESEGINEVDYHAAKEKINVYEDYIKGFKDKRLNEVEEKQAIDVLNKADNLEAAMKQIEETPDISQTNKEAQLAAYEQERKKYVKQLQEVYSGEYFKKKEKELEKEAEENIKQAEETTSQIKDIASKISKGETEFTPEELQVQQNFPKELEVELQNIKAEEPPLPNPPIEAFKDISEGAEVKPKRVLPEKVIEEQQKLTDFGDVVTKGKGLKSRAVIDSEKADILKDFLETTSSKEISGGTIELPPYARTLEYGVHYNVDIGGNVFKTASRYYTKGHKEKVVVDTPVKVKLIKPSDKNLGILKKDVIVGKEGEKVFKFKESEYPDMEYGYVLQVQNEETGEPIANIRTSDFGKGRKVRVAEKKVTPKETQADDDFPTIQFQKISNIPKDTLEDFTKKAERLRKALPGIQLVVDPDIDVAGQLDADGKTVRVNPNYYRGDTAIHEYGHALIDILSSKDNPFVELGIEQLRGTELWNSVADKYSELDADMLAKEVLATAIGQEGAKIFENEKKQSAFVKWVNDFFNKLKDLLGIERSAAKRLAKQLLSGKEISAETVATNQVQRQKLDKKVEQELKTLKDSKPQSFAQWLKSKGSSLKEAKENLQKIQDEIDQTEDAVRLDELQEDKTIIEESVNSYKAEYDQYLKGREEVIKLVESKGDVSKMSENDLIETKNLLSKYADIRSTQSYKDILFNIGQKMNDIQVNKLKETNPDYDPSKEQGEDLRKSDVWSQGLSTISEKFPAIQAFYKKYRTAFSSMNTEFNKIKTEGEKLARAVISEYQKSQPLTKRAKNFVVGGGDKYFSYMAKDGKLIEKDSPEYKKLSKAQRDLLDFVTDKKNNLAENIGVDEDVLLKSNAGFVESLQKSGIYKAYANWLTRNYNLRNIKVDFKDPKTGVKSYQYFGDVENLLEDYSKGGIISKVHAAALLTKYNIQARGLLAKKAHADPKEKFDLRGGSGRYFLAPDGRLVSMFSGNFKGDFTENYYEAFMKYAKDATFSKHMNPLMPVLNGVEAFYKSFGRNKENVVKFLDVVKKGKFLGETIESGLGTTADTILSVLRKWTSWRFMAFNYKANLFNVVVGEYNQFRADGGKSFIKGKARMAKSLTKGKGNRKALNILNKYLPDILSDVDNVNPERNLGHFFELASFGGLKVGEMYIRGSAIIGKISNEHYNWFDDKGNIKGTPEQVAEREAIMKEEMLKYETQVDMIQGRYSELNRRNFAYFELGQFFGQFKTWMPEWLSERFAGEYIDADGIKRKGSFRTLLTYGLKDLLRDASKKEFYTSSNPKHIAARRQLRGMIITATLYLLYLDSSDDDRDKELAYNLDKALRNISSMYRMDNNTFLISQPAAGTSAVLDLANAFSAAVKDVKKVSTEGNEVDLKSPEEFFNLIPGNLLIKQPMEAFEDEE